MNAHQRRKARRRLPMWAQQLSTCVKTQTKLLDQIYKKIHTFTEQINEAIRP